MTHYPTQFREVASGLGFPEGPIALPDGSCLVVEMQARALARVGTDGRIARVAKLDGGPNGGAIGPDGKCYICNNGGVLFHTDEYGLRPMGQDPGYRTGSIDRVDLETGNVEVLYETSDKGNLRSPNDIVFDRHGGFWFTDSGKTRPRDADRGSVCYARADGSECREVIFPMLVPNGIGLSPDQQTLYVAETHTARLWAFELSAPGEIVRKPWPSPHGGTLVAGLPGYQWFDSLAVDSAGNICVATLIKGGVTVISPDGKNIDYVPLPDMYSTNICFGGSNQATAFVTLANSGRLVALDWPHPGLALNC
ncbi:SMP-30/gluconolactonase/LRE family protein [Pseudaminobacter salicylatoxidans]|uniref:SMP-30/gluconolactonase/LRE family protein n=1 Tax=Pseudaminobacter salicylatoxidans TaxID=93369 RepID=UPI0003170E97|nr:SMP-30/gluconolactonase/LRE family protein [Pseudaminobacter salicylatoxidans]